MASTLGKWGLYNHKLGDKSICSLFAQRNEIYSHLENGL